MFGHKFYHGLTRKYISIFGTIFNDITIVSEDGNSIKVPINFGPIEKFYARLQQDSNFDRPISLTLPRISFNLTGMSYDGDRKRVHHQSTIRGIADPDNRQKIWTPNPYNMDFELTIMTRYLQDGQKILEQIVPFFKPNFTVGARLITGFEEVTDIPIVLTSINTENSYEGAFEERQVLTWTLTFNMKTYFWGPIQNKKVIKFVTANIETEDGGIKSTTTIRPGLTIDGEPTTDPNNSIDYLEINVDDFWDYITDTTYG